MPMDKLFPLFHSFHPRKGFKKFALGSPRFSVMRRRNWNLAVEFRPNPLR